MSTLRIQRSSIRKWQHLLGASRFIPYSRRIRCARHGSIPQLAPYSAVTVKKESVVGSIPFNKHYDVCDGEIFNGQYEAICDLGQGYYATVWLARSLAANLESNKADRGTSVPEFVAIKILRSDLYGGPKPIFEREILHHIQSIRAEHAQSRYVIRLFDDFVHSTPEGDHVCLVTELLGYTVRDLQQKASGRQLPLHTGQQICRQVLCALDWLHESCNVIHTDLKPDNIMLEIPDLQLAVRNCIGGDGADLMRTRSLFWNAPPLPEDPRFKIIDLGVASWRDKHLSELIQPISLRAPEVFIGAPWDTAVDIWSLGCIMYEIMQGRVLFRGREGPEGKWSAEEDQLAQMVELLGPIPISLREVGTRSGEYFDTHGNLTAIDQIYPYLFADLLQQTPNPTMTSGKYTEFESFLKSMLRYNPRDRVRPKDLLNHPWLVTNNT